MGIRVAFFALVSGCVAGACTATPSIEGSQVPTVASPDCAQTCARLAALCGYAPDGDGCTTAAGDGYCDTQLDTTHRDCVGQAPSCQAAWDCTNALNDDAGGETDADAAAAE